MLSIHALSIAGPFGYWLASAKKTAYGTKQIELRSWKRFLKPGTVVLIHVSSNSEYNHWFEPLDISHSSAPKFSLIGAATFQGCRLYSSEELWERDRQVHCWMGDEDWKTVRNECYGGDPVGHVFTNPILFSEPILDVPGDWGYWRPNPKKPQFEKQQKGFELATALLQQLDYQPDYKPEPKLEKPKKQPKPKHQPNRTRVVFGRRSIGFSSPNRIWDIDYPPPAFVEALKQTMELDEDGSGGVLYMTPEEIKNQYLSYIPPTTEQ